MAEGSSTTSLININLIIPNVTATSRGIDIAKDLDLAI